MSSAGGLRADGVVAVAGVEHGPGEFAIDQTVERVFEGTRKQLPLAIHRDEPRAGVNRLVARHGTSRVSNVGITETAACSRRSAGAGCRAGLSAASLAVSMPEHLDDPTLKVVIAFVAGLFSLLGAFAGAFLAQRTEYLKWLRQNRSETFAEFLAKLADAKKAAIDVLHMSQLEALQRNSRITEIYSAPENYARILRLCLPRSRREEVSGLASPRKWVHFTRP